MTRAVVPNSPEMAALLDALGLPPNTVSFNLRARLNLPVTVTCRYYPEAGKFGELMTTRFALVALEPGHTMFPASRPDQIDRASAIQQSIFDKG